MKFGSKLERIEELAFIDCTALKRITIPLKDGIIAADDIFEGCVERVDLVEGEVYETIAALQMEEWRNEMKEEIDSINQILPTTPADFYHYHMDHHDDGGNARAIRTWLRSVLRKIIHHKAQHQRIVDEAATYLQLALPRDIVTKNVLPFLELPSYTFELVDHEEEEDDSVREEEVEEEEQGDDNEHSDDDFDDDSNTSLEGDESRKRRRIEDHA